MTESGHRGYALDVASPVRYVATRLEAAAPAAVSVADLGREYGHRHLPADLHRIQRHEGATSEADAARWLVRHALSLLGRHVEETEEGFRLVSEFEEIRVNRRKIYRWIESDPEVDEKRAIKAAYTAVREGYPIHVKVEGARGSVKERRLRLHPVARMLPLMSEKEFGDLVQDVKEYGFKDPIYTIEDEILDGRHRAAVASVLDVPLRSVEFAGDETEAKHLVISLNLRRRHLTAPQRTQLVRELFLPDAKVEAKKRMQSGGGYKGNRKRESGTPDYVVPDESQEQSSEEPETSTTHRAKGKTAVQIAAEKSGGLASAHSLHSMAPVDDAPRTRERVLSGEIKTIEEARREALLETNSGDPDTVPPKVRGTWDTLGRSRYWLRKTIDAQQAGVGLGVHKGGKKLVTPGEHLKRLAEIRSLCDEYEAGLNGGTE